MTNFLKVLAIAFAVIAFVAVFFATLGAAQFEHIQAWLFLAPEDSAMFPAVMIGCLAVLLAGGIAALICLFNIVWAFRNPTIASGRWKV